MILLLAHLLLPSTYAQTAHAPEMICSEITSNMLRNRKDLRVPLSLSVDTASNCTDQPTTQTCTINVMCMPVPGDWNQFSQSKYQKNFMELDKEQKTAIINMYQRMDDKAYRAWTKTAGEKDDDNVNDKRFKPILDWLPTGLICQRESMSVPGGVKNFFALLRRNAESLIQISL